MNFLKITILFISLPFFSFAQNTLNNFLDSALINNSEAVSIRTQIHSYQFDDQMISAILRSPKAFLSSEILVAPYLNNDGKPIDISPLDKAIGYDSGITNGGLYSFLFNLELPLLKGKQIINLQKINEVEVKKLENRLIQIKNEINLAVGGMYCDVLAQQLTVENNRKNTELLNEEFQIIKSLTNKGLYRISDYKLIELELKSDSVNLNSSINDLELALRQLKIACGIRNSNISRLNNPNVEMVAPLTAPSLFTLTFREDSLSAVYQQNSFNDRYLPQLSVYANSGLNSTSIPLIQRHIGISAGIQLSYTLFDGQQKKINHEQQLLRIDEANKQKSIKLNEVRTQADALSQNIEKIKKELLRQKQIQKEYQDLLTLYQEEVQRAQISVIDLIAFLQKYSDIRLNVSLKEITLNKMINEYNYWNH